MPLSTDVNLPRDHEPIFPERCIDCGCDPEGNRVLLATHTLSWMTWLLWSFGSGVKVHVPACKRCARRIWVQRTGGLVVTLVIAIVFMFFAWPFFADRVPPAFRRWVAMGMIMICILPLVMWEIFFPPSIDITAFKQSVDYEFRDLDMAHEFAELNEDAEWVKVE